jgi:hypothetical protein
MACRLLASAPVDRASGVTPRVNAIEVMRMGRRRSRQADHHDPPDLEIDIVLHTVQPGEAQDPQRYHQQGKTEQDRRLLT